MVNGSLPQQVDPGSPAHGAFADPDRIRQGAFLALRGIAIVALLVGVVRAPLHISVMWATALSSGTEDANSPAGEFLLYLDAVRRDPSAWHVVSLVMNGLLAGIVIRLGALRGWAANLPFAIGVGLFGAVMGEWAFGHFGFTFPAGISPASVLAALAAGVTALLLGHAISRM